MHDERSYRHYQPALKIAPRIRAIILKAVNPDPAARYPSVAALAADVRHFIYDEEVSAAPDNLFQKFFRLVYRNRIKSILITGLLFALLCGELFYSYYRANREQEHLRRQPDRGRAGVRLRKHSLSRLEILRQRRL